ncbi:MAG: SDR family NAD(P)-dependent oxidoreductase [Clostridia bacterium]|nr:SDR family NAD(P)-dependent oxidoreductase [Clostridia bacterium]
MKTEAWLAKNASSLKGKTIAVTGTTGGIGKELCRHLAALGADLILMDRNEIRSQAFREELMRDYPVTVKCIPVELSDIESVKTATEALKRHTPDVFLHNAGAYSIPRHTCSTGFDNVFQINFVSPYYIIRELLPLLRERNGHVEVMGSIAHRYSKTDPHDVDFSKRTRASLVYGNAKRYLMCSLYELFQGEKDVTLSVVHPGITFTNITSHYPKLVFAIIKHPMKIIFQHPRRAALSAVKGLYSPCEHLEWIGPRIFDIWGLPAKKHLRGIRTEECKRIGETADKIYQSM